MLVMGMSSKKHQIPAIRFKGFTDAWEQRKLGDIADIKDSARISNELWVENGIPYLRSSDLVNGELNGELFISKETYEGYASKTGAPQKDDVLFTSGGKVGVVYHKKDESPVYVQGGAVLYVKTSTSNLLDGSFLSIYFGSPRMQTYMDIASSGGTIKHFTLKPANASPIIFPGLSEQQKIGAFFKELDKTIALHLCKQRQLELLKQRLIKEILPQSDSTLPHLRFANFRKPWEQHQLKEVLKVNSGRDYKHLNEGNIPVYGTGGYMLSVDGKLSDVDGIGLGRKGTIDKPQYLKAPFWTVATLFYLTPSPNYDIYFLYTLIQTVNWKSMDESTGVPSLSKSVIERVTLTFPILEEQQKIGSFFREFDNTISLHQQKIAHLKALKSTILNKMFI